MNDINIFYSSLAAVGIIVLAGFILGKTKVITAETNKHMINLLLNVAWPCAIFGAFPQVFSWEKWGDFRMGIFGGAVILAAMLILSKILFHKKFFKGGMASEGQFAFIFNNASFLGYPLVSAMFPDLLLPYCGFILVFNIILFSYGVFLFEKKMTWKTAKDILLNPNIISVVLGTIFFLFSLELPDFANQSVKYIGGIMTPMSLICIGYMLSRAELLQLFRRWKLFIIALLQLVLGPLVAYYLLGLLGFSNEIRSMLVLLQALPTATSLGLFAEKYGGDATEASELVAISTLLSVATLPVIIGLLIGL